MPSPVEAAAAWLADVMELPAGGVEARRLSRAMERDGCDGRMLRELRDTTPKLRRIVLRELLKPAALHRGRSAEPAPAPETEPKLGPEPEPEPEPQPETEPQPEPEEDGEDGEACRFCMEVSPAAELFQPCGCRGSMAKIHHGCLERWQLTIVRGPGGSLANANTCGICGEEFVAAGRLERSAVVAVNLEGHDLGFLAPLVRWAPQWLLNFGHRVFELDERFVWIVFVALIASVFHVFFADSFNRAYPMNLSSGVVLLATEYGKPARSMWTESVILVLEHNRDGAKGVILNQPMYGLDVDVRTVPLPHVEELPHRRLIPGSAWGQAQGTPAMADIGIMGESELTSAGYVSFTPEEGSSQHGESTPRWPTKEEPWEDDSTGTGAPAVVRWASYGGPVERQRWTVLHNATPAHGGAKERPTGSRVLTVGHRVLGQGPPGVSPATMLHQPEDLFGSSYGGQWSPRASEVLWWEDEVNMASLAGRLCTPDADTGRCEGYCFSGGAEAPGYHSAIKWGPNADLRCEPQREAHSRLFAGYASWSPGQLEGEIRRGVWRIHPTPTAAHVLETPASELWSMLTRQVLTGKAGAVGLTKVCVCSMTDTFTCTDEVIEGENGDMYANFNFPIDNAR